MPHNFICQGESAADCIIIASIHMKKFSFYTSTFLYFIESIGTNIIFEEQCKYDWHGTLSACIYSAFDYLRNRKISP